MPTARAHTAAACPPQDDTTQHTVFVPSRPRRRGGVSREGSLGRHGAGTGAGQAYQQHHWMDSRKQ